MKTRLLYLLPLLLTVTLIIFGEALGDLWKEDVKAVFQQNKWLLLAFVLLLALVGFLWERQQRSAKPVAEEVDKDQYDEAFVQFRKNLLEQYRIRLNSKTGRRLPVNLTAKSTHFGMAPERVEAYFKDKELTIESEDIASEIDKILKKFDRLLLIGDPGAGKTTILLYAAINVLNTSYSSDDSEWSDELQKLPLILNLATWRVGRDFGEWYAQNIAHSYSLNPVFVQELLRRNAVVPFFDGFDEVAEESRGDCFRKMAAYFGDEKRKQLIVSSRKKEYAAAEADAPVYAEIEVQPLSLAQIKKALSENAQSQAADRALLHAFEHDRWLAEAVETPFYLNTASFLFGKGQRTLADFPFVADSTEGRQAELVEIFVAEQAPEERDRKYLHFLAGKMEQENFLVFELVKMQPGWCKRRRFWQLITVLLFSVPTFVLFDRFYDFQYDHIISIIVSLAIGFFISLEFPMLGEIEESWSWHEFRRKWKSRIIQILMWGIPIGAILIALSHSGKFFSFVSFLITFSCFSFLLDSGKIERFSFTGTYQRFWAGFAVVIIYLFCMLAGIFVASASSHALTKVESDWNAEIDPWQTLLSFWPFFLLIPIGISGAIQHFSLRLVLYLEGKMPLRVVTFMDHMTEQLIFEDNRRTNKKGKKMRGAIWRFRHKILQDYFAGTEEVSSFEERKR